MNKPVLIAVVLIVAVISLPLLAKMAGGQRVGQDAVRSQGSDGNTLAIEGVWEGALSVPGTQTAVRIVFRISESPDGTFSAAADSPDQGTRDIPVDEITLENRNLRLQLDSISGVFAGQVQEDGMAIHGTWQQDGQTLPLVLERATSRTGTTQSEVGPLGADVFKIKDVDVGDQSWGLNLLRVSVENLSGEPQPFWLHVGGRYQDTGRPRGFGMGMEEPVVLDAHEERIVEHPY